MKSRPLRDFERGAHLHVLDWAHQTARVRLQAVGAVQVKAAARAIAASPTPLAPRLPSLEAAVHGELAKLYALGHASVRSELDHQRTGAPLPVGLSQAWAADAITLAYNPDEPRDWHGRWGEGLLGDLSALSAADRTSVVADVAKIPADALAVLNDAGVRVEVSKDANRLGAFYDPGSQTVKIRPVGALQGNEGRAPVILHELGHAFDYATGHRSSWPGFRSLWKDAKPKDPYFRKKYMGGVPQEEMFAEAVAHIWNGTEPPASDFVLTAYLRELITGLASQHTHAAALSAPALTLAVADPPGALAHLAARAHLIASDVAHQIHQAIHRARLQGITGRKTLRALGREAGHAALRSAASHHAGGAIFAGRHAAALGQAAQIAGARYTSVLDKNSCQPCIDADTGQLLALDDPGLVHPPNPACLGGDRCRCILVYQLATEHTPAPLQVPAVSAA